MVPELKPRACRRLGLSIRTSAAEVFPGAAGGLSPGLSRVADTPWRPTARVLRAACPVADFTRTAYG